jgi:hypothetical protein
METNERVAQLESEIKILKNEVQAVLLDLRDKYLEAENPFNAPLPPAAPQQIIIDRQAPAPAAKPAPAPAGNVEEEDEAGDEDDNSSTTDDRPEPPAPVRTMRASERQQPAAASQLAPARADDSGRDMGLVTIAGLACWADESVRRLGRQRTETILDLSQMIGFLGPDLKEILVKLVKVEADDQACGITARDYFDSLMKITTLLGKDNQTEETMLSILSGENGHR